MFFSTSRMNTTRFNRFIQSSKIDKKLYQEEGIRWCVDKEINHKDGVRGGFICDEMGLGKTIMMLAVIVVNMIPRTLIVLPNALIEQWNNELKEFELEYNKWFDKYSLYNDDIKSNNTLNPKKKNIQSNKKSK